MGKHTRKVIQRMLEHDVKEVERRGPIPSNAFGYERTRSKEQRSILVQSESSLYQSFERTKARAQERLDDFLETGKLPPAPTEKYTFFKEGNAPTSEVTRRR